MTNKNKITLDQMFGVYCEEFHLYDKYGINTVAKGMYRTKDGKRVYYLEDAFKMKPTCYVKGSWQSVRNYMYDKVVENMKRRNENEVCYRNFGSFSVA